MPNPQSQKKIPIYEMMVSEDDTNSGVSLISFVDQPAIESGFIALSSVGVKMAQNAQKQILTGPVLIPDKNIPRIDENGQPYVIRFSAKTIEAIRNKFFKDKKTDQTNSQHEIPLESNHIVESWIVVDPKNDKSAALGLSGLPVGTWMVSYKVNDKAYWDNEIMTGKRKGFSLEGVFGMKPVKLAMAKVKTITLTAAQKSLQEARSREAQRRAEINLSYNPPARTNLTPAQKRLQQLRTDRT